MHNYKPKYYDIRIRSGKKKSVKKQKQCEWENCQEIADCRAPKSPQNLNSFFWFCIKHVQQYNKSWNFFQNMSETETEAYQKDMITGHRPTWKVSLSSSPQSAIDLARYKIWKSNTDKFIDTPDQETAPLKSKRHLPRLQKQAYETLGLEPLCDKKMVSERYSMLVKQYHPDYNGGNRSWEEDLKKVMHAYRILKEAKRI